MWASNRRGISTHTELLLLRSERKADDRMAAVLAIQYGYIWDLTMIRRSVIARIYPLNRESLSHMFAKTRAGLSIFCVTLAFVARRLSERGALPVICDDATIGMAYLGHFYPLYYHKGCRWKREPVNTLMPYKKGFS